MFQGNLACVAGVLVGARSKNLVSDEAAKANSAAARVWGGEAGIVASPYWEKLSDNTILISLTLF